MKKLLLLLFSVCVFVSCSEEIPEEKASLKFGRTVMAYLISNNSPGYNLDKNLKLNLVDMYSGLSKSDGPCTLLVYYRPYSNDADGLSGPSLLQYISDGEGNINSRPCLQGADLTPSRVIAEAVCSPYTDNNHNATDPQIMARVLGDMVKLSRSTRYGLIFGSHGKSWMKGKTVPGRSFGDDDGYEINIPEMAETLKGVFSGKQLDFILFDACMMATAEVCYEFRDVTDYLVGSVVETHVYGHPYDVILPKLYERDVPYSDICKDYIDYSRQLKAWGTCAAIDCKEIGELAGWVKANLDAYSEKLPALDIKTIQQYGKDTYEYFSFDVEDFFRVLNDNNVPEGLEEVLNKVVVAKEALYGVQYSIVQNPLYQIEEGRFCGIGMYFPFRTGKSAWDSYYESSVSWYKAVQWDRLKTSLTGKR